MLIITIVYTVPADVLNMSITSPSAVVAGSDYTFRCEATRTIQGLTNTPTALWEASDGQQITTEGNVVISNPSTGVTELSFTGIRTNQAGLYICRGTLTSPALMVARESTSTVSVSVEGKCHNVVCFTSCVVYTVPSPTVILTTPTSPLTAGTPQDITCSVTVDTAVTTDVSVSVTLERMRGSEVVAITTETLADKSSSTLVTLTVNTMDTEYTCRATYMTTSGVMSPPGEDTQPITVMSMWLC